MDYLSKEEAQCVHEAYKDQGFISVIREKSRGYVCEIPKELNTWDKRRVSVGDLLYHFDKPDTCVELLAITPVDECTSFKITIKCENEEEVMTVDDFSEFKTSPWSVKERVKMMAICGIAMSVSILLVGCLIGGFLYLVWSDTIIDLLVSSDSASSEVQELDSFMLQAWSLIRPVVTGTVVYTGISIALKRLMK